MRRRRLVRVLMLAAMAGVGVLLASPWSARAENTVPVGTHLSGVLARLGGVSTLGPLAEPLPLIGGTPAELLGLDQLLDELSTALGDNDLSATDIEGLEGTYGDVTVDIKGPNGADDPLVAPSGTPNVTDVAFRITATSTVDLPVAYADDVLDLDGGNTGTVPVTITLATSLLHFQHDAGITDPALLAQAFWLRSMPADPVPVAERKAPALTLSIDADNADLVDFTETVGIADVTVNGSFTMHAAVASTLADPDQPTDGKLTADELLNTAVDELATVAFAASPATPDLAASLSLTATGLTGTAPVATLTATDTDLTTAPGPVVTPTLGDLSSFLNMTPSDLIGSIDRLATWLGTVASSGQLDPEIPFLGGTFSDALDVKEALLDLAGDLRWDSDQVGTQLDDTGLPKFTTVSGFEQLLTDAGFPVDLSFAGSKLTFDLAVAGDIDMGFPLGFGNLDVVQGISVQTGAANLETAYEAGLGVALDLSPLPKESPESGPLSCVDGVDNDGGSDIDAADAQCAGLPTLEQRVLVDVGTAAGTPEISATAKLDADAISATGTVGLLGVAIKNATVVLDDGAGDPAAITVDLYEEGGNNDGLLTIEELVNALGGTGNGKVATAIDAHLAATLPVSAELGSVPLGGGSIVVTADVDGPLTDPGVLLHEDNFDVDASSLQAAPLFDFSPCDNDRDDDGDGVVNDGCPAPGSPLAVSDPESQSTAMFQAVIDMLRALADKVDALGEENFAGVSLDDDLPIIGRSVSELADLGDPLLELADRLTTPSESSIQDGCTGSEDDDHDGVVNDGCPTAPALTNPPQVPAPAPEVGADCIDAAPDANGDDDGDGVVNDGCLPVSPSLQTLADYLSGLLTDELQKAIDGIKSANAPAPTLTVTVTPAYDATTRSLDLVAEIDSTVRATTSFNLGLGGGLAGYELVGLEATGDLAVDVVTDATIGFGLDLDDFRPYLLGNTDLSVTAQAVGEGLELAASLGPLSVQLGNNTPQPEVAADGECDANTSGDDDDDGFANDGCAGQLNPEKGAECGDGKDSSGPNDTDNVADDGCPNAPPKQGDDAETQCANGLDEDEDGVADDGCGAGGAAPTAGDAQKDKEGVDNDGNETDDCDRGNTADEDNDGHVNDGCPARGNPGLAYLGAGFAIAESGADADRHFFDDADIAFESGNDPDPAFAGVHPAQCTNDLVSGASTAVACARLPIYADLGVGLQFLSPLTMKWDDFASAPTITVDEQALLDAIGQMALDLLLLKSGLGQWIDRLESLLRDGLFGIDLPLIGDALDEAADFVASLRDAENLTSTLSGALDGSLGTSNPLAGLADAAAVQAQVNSLAANIDTALSDEFQQDGQFVTGQVLCDHGGPDPEPCDGDDGMTDVEDVVFTVPLGQTANPATPEFDIGVPGFGIKSESGVGVEATWAVTLKLGVSRTDGFYLDTEAGDELSVSALLDLGDAPLEATLGFLKVNIYDGGPTTNCDASSNVDPRTGTCDVDGGTHLPQTTFGPSFTIDLLGGADGDDRLTMGDISQAPDFGDLFTYDFAVTADINLHLVTSIAGDASGEFPRLFTDLTLDWGYNATNSDDPEDLRDPSDLDMALGNVALDAGSFLRDFIGPVVNNVQTFTEPLQPVIEQLNAPIPILSDFAGKPVTLLDLIVFFGATQDIDLGLIEDIVKFIDFINGLQAPSGSNLFVVPLSGLFELNSNTLLSGPLDQSQARGAFDPADLAAADANSLLDDLSNATPDASTSEIKKAEGLHEIGLFFPFVERPSQLLGLLFGQDVDLVIWQPRELTASFSYSQKFGPIWSLPPVFLEVGGSAGVTGRFGIGYDTQGLREVLFEGADGGALLHGLFLLDRRLNDDGSFQTDDPAEIELFGELFANAQVSVLIFSAGAQGSVYTKLGLNLNDPNNDGKLKWTEAADTLRATGNPICLFTFEGRFGVTISIFAEIDLFFWSQRWTKTLADIILYEFEVNCADPVPPVLASTDEGMDLDALPRPDGSTGGDVFGPGNERVLKLHVGAHRGLRGSNSVGIDEKEEEFFLVKEKDGSVTVTALGISRNYAGPWDAVYVDGGTDGADGGDNITLGDNVVKGENEPVTNGGDETVNRCGVGDSDDDDGDGRVNDGCPAEPAPDPEDENAPAAPKEEGDACLNATDDDGDGFVNDGCPAVETSIPFDIKSWIVGGGGDDQITAGHSVNVVYGKGGKDRVTTKEGRDWVAGEEGDDQIGLGDDADASGQEDFADGGAGHDVIDGGPGRDILRGGTGDDNLIGGLTIPAQPGDPAKLKAAIPEQADGRDRLEGGTGKDDLDGGPADDTVIGGGDADRLNGGDGADTLWGDGENDAASASPDLCATFPTGNAAYDDVLVGGDGADAVHAGAGDDIVVGGNITPGRGDVGDTNLSGDPGCDLVIGDNASFTVDTDPRAFVLLDAATGGGDTMHGGSGDDVLRGSVGDDPSITGDAGEDVMYGDGGTDTLDGGTDRDIVYGDSGGTAPAAFATPGNDVVIGGDGNDDLYGEGGTDTMLGDVGSVAGNAAVTLTSGSGTDLMYGGGQDDRMYGQGGVDTMFGDGGADYMLGNDAGDVMRGGIGEDEMFGNNGADQMWGDAGTDRMSGGSDADSAPDNGTDTMYGGSGTDVMVGDNGTITASPALVETLLSDGTPAQLASLGGDADVMYGEAEADRMYGELGNDRMRGGSGDDYLEGNANGPAPVAPAVLDCSIAAPLGDLLVGESEQDDLIGGGDDAGYADGADCIFGEGNVDVMAGDNASVTRPGGTDAYDGAVKRSVDLLDLFTDPAGIAGADVMSGGEGPDRMFGGGVGETLMHGNGGDDYLEGNGGGDTVYGDAGQDDVIGGTSQNDVSGSVFTGRDVAPGGNPPSGPKGGTVPDGADTLYGDDGAGGAAAGHDLLAGDNASLIRPVQSAGPGAGQWFLDDLDTARGVSDVARRVLQLFDVATATDPTADASGRSAGDFLYGENGHDVVYGQGGGDLIRGGPVDDYLEGGNGSDDVQGNNGQDDIVGGTGRTRTDNPASADDGRLDVGDTLYGGNGNPTEENDASDLDDYDVVMGDNATVLRGATGAPGETWAHHDYAGTGVQVVTRTVTLHDVATLAYAPAAGSSGGDTLYGEDADDLLYGQGGTDTVKGGGGDDVVEGNAGADQLFGEGDEDDMLGGTGLVRYWDDPAGVVKIDAYTVADLVGGTAGRADGADTMYGGGDSDVMLGDNGVVDRLSGGASLWKTKAYKHFPDGHNATTANAAPVAVGSFTRTDRLVRMTDVAPDAQGGSPLTAGSDLMSGGVGDDTMFGQFDDTAEGSFTLTKAQIEGFCPTSQIGAPLAGDVELWGDLACGGAGEDAVLGDQGVVEDVVTVGPATFIKPKDPFVSEWTNIPATLERRTQLTTFDKGGDDALLGGSESDSMHAGAGGDVVNANDGDDRVFGGQSPRIGESPRLDALWGGPHNDHVYGGFGDDFLDVQPRIGIANFPTDPELWFVVAPAFNLDADPAPEKFPGFEGFDQHYGGWNQDALQADEGDNGPVRGDRLLDWAGAHNIYYLCPSTYGAYVSIRAEEPGLLDYLNAMATADGLVSVTQKGTPGYDELALVYKPDIKFNANPAHPDTPGHFSCEVVEL